MRHALSILGLSLSCLLCTALAGQAQDKPPRYSAVHEKCVAESQGVTIALVECDSAESDRQDKILNGTYTEILARLSHPSDAGLKAALQKAERAWIAWRDAECDFQYETEAGGTLARIVSAGCYLAMTSGRVRELRSTLEQINTTR